MKFRARWCAVVALFGAVPAPVQTQMTVRVVDPFDRPIPAVMILPPTGDEPLLTDMTGRARLPAAWVERAGTLTFARLGFVERRIPVELIADGEPLVLNPHPVAISGIEVQPAPLVCPTRTDASAHEALMAVLARYPLPGANTTWGTQVLHTQRGRLRLWGGEARREDFRSIPIWSEIRRDPAWDPDVIAREGFGRDWVGMSFSERDGPTRYLPLDGAGSIYLPVLPILPRVRVEEPSPDVFRVCVPEADERIGLAAEFVIDGARIESVSWRYLEEDGTVSAGGQAWFSGDVLLPFRGSFWRETSEGRFFIEERDFGPWVVGTRDEVAAFMAELAVAWSRERAPSH